MAYLDHAATTPMLPAAVAAMTAELTAVGNPSSLHGSGRRARRVVEESRERVAASLGSRPSEVIFTGGGTESNNLALKGLFWSRRAEDPRRRRVLVSAVEHHAVLDPAQWLAQYEGAEVELLPVDRLGRVDPQAVRDAIAADPDSVALVSVMWANNEIGTIQPIASIVSAAHEFGIPVHSDAVQAAGLHEVDFAGSDLDALTVTGHKVGGPFGVGTLVLRRSLTPVPLLHGGGQERDVRSGTLDAPAIVGFSAALANAVEDRHARTQRIGALRDVLVAAVQSEVPTAILNGDPDPAGRLPGNAHFSFPGCAGDDLLLLLDARGVECSTGSACSAGVAQPSHVLLATGVDEATALASLRFSLGHTTTEDEVEELRAVIGPVVTRAQRASVMTELRATP